MFTGNEDMEATALREQGWSISAIARHLGRCRETVRNHLNGERVAGERRRAGPDPFDEYVPYLRARFSDDPHLWASALFDEVVELGFPLSRKGSVEKSIDFATGRFWRTMTAPTMATAQDQFDRFWVRIGDKRARPLARLAALLGTEEQAMRLLADRGRRRPTVGDLAELESLIPLPAACYPATIEAHNTVGPSCLVPFEGNRYSVPTGLVGAQVTVRHRLGTEGVEIISGTGVPLATHRRHIPGGGYVVRDPVHKLALEQDVLAALRTGAPCRRKANRPPGDAARAEAARLAGSAEDALLVVDLAAYQALVDDMATEHRQARS